MYSLVSSPIVTVQMESPEDEYFVTFVDPAFPCLYPITGPSFESSVIKSPKEETPILLSVNPALEDINLA